MMSVLSIPLSSAAASAPASFFDFSATDIDGKVVKMDTFRKFDALLVVNVASECGLTSRNYEELVDLRDKYHDSGLEVLLFPCNQFGSQEPGDPNSIKTFVNEKGAGDIPLMAKVDVNGENAHPLFVWLRKTKPMMGTSLFGGHIPWNFGKFLIDGSNGEVIESYLPTTPPSSIEKDIRQVLGKSDDEM